MDILKNVEEFLREETERLMCLTGAEKIIRNLMQESGLLRSLKRHSGKFIYKIMQL